jgi:fructose 1,6-bisphosphatase
MKVALNTITVSFVVDLMLWKGKVFEILNNNNVKVLFFNAPNTFY